MPTNLRTKLESKEKKWISVLLLDSTELTGLLKRVGADFIELECYGSPLASEYEDVEDETGYSEHLIPLSLVKVITTEANFVEAERKRLEYISHKSQISETTGVPDIEK